MEHILYSSDAGQGARLSHDPFILEPRAVIRADLSLDSWDEPTSTAVFHLDNAPDSTPLTGVRANFRDALRGSGVSVEGSPEAALGWEEEPFLESPADSQGRDELLPGAAAYLRYRLSYPHAEKLFVADFELWPRSGSPASRSLEFPPRALRVEVEESTFRDQHQALVIRNRPDSLPIESAEVTLRRLDTEETFGPFQFEEFRRTYRLSGPFQERILTSPTDGVPDDRGYLLIDFSDKLSGVEYAFEVNLRAEEASIRRVLTLKPEAPRLELAVLEPDYDAASYQLKVGYQNKVESNAPLTSGKLTLIELNAPGETEYRLRIDTVDLAKLEPGATEFARFVPRGNFSTKPARLILEAEEAPGQSWSRDFEIPATCSRTIRGPDHHIPDTTLGGLRGEVDYDSSADRLRLWSYARAAESIGWGESRSSRANGVIYWTVDIQGPPGRTCLANIFFETTVVGVVDVMEYSVPPFGSRGEWAALISAGVIKGESFGSWHEAERLAVVWPSASSRDSLAEVIRDELIEELITDNILETVLKEALERGAKKLLSVVATETADTASSGVPFVGEAIDLAKVGWELMKCNDWVGRTYPVYFLGLELAPGEYNVFVLLDAWTRATATALGSGYSEIDFFDRDPNHCKEKITAEKGIAIKNLTLWARRP